MKHPIFTERLDDIQRKEQALLVHTKRVEKSHALARPAFDRLERLVPDGVRSALQNAFASGLQMLLSTGMSTIDKIVEQVYPQSVSDTNRKVLHRAPSADNLKAVRIHAQKVRWASMGVTALEGAALGTLGIGLPDIPLFMGVLLSGCFVTAKCYGYPYHETTEKAFLLQVLQGALADAADFPAVNGAVDRALMKMVRREWQVSDKEREDLLQGAAEVLSDSLLLIKCVQGLPVIGALGAVGNTISYKKVTDYAANKYEKRFLLEQIRSQGVEAHDFSYKGAGSA